MKRVSRRLAWIIIAILLLAPAGWLIGRQVWAYHHFHAAQADQEAFDYDSAYLHISAALKVWPHDPDTLLLAARLARLAGKFAPAREHLSALAEFRASTSDYVLESQLLLAHQGQTSVQEDYALRRRVEVPGRDNPLILEALAQGYLHGHRYGLTLSCIERLFELEPKHVSGMVIHGRLMEDLNRYAEAMENYRAALSLQPRLNAVRLRLAQLLLAGDRRAEAQAQFEELLAKSPGAWEARLGLAHIARLGGKNAEARSQYEQLIKERPDDATTLRELGQIALAEEALAEAERWLRRAIEVDAYDPRTCHALSECLNRLGTQEEAATWSAKSKSLDEGFQLLKKAAGEAAMMPANLETRLECGRLCLRIGRTKEALRWFGGVLAADPECLKAHEALANYYDAQGQAEKAAYHRRWLEK